MVDRLREPGGTLGTLSMVSALALMVFGAIGVVALAISLVLDSSFWSDTAGNKVLGIVFFALTAAGGYGFVLMHRSPWGGAALAVLGGLAFAVVVFWAILPVVVGIGAAVVAVVRARAMQSRATIAGASGAST